MGTLLIDILRGVLGWSVLLGFCWLICGKRKNINWRLIAAGLGLQVTLALIVMKVPVFASFVGWVSSVFVAIISFSEHGALFIFGPNLVDNSFGAIFAFKVLPSIIFFSALSSILYYLGILQMVVYAFAWVMRRTMGLSGAESLAMAANIFVGQTEAPLVVRPYLESMSRSEMMCLMTGGMATIAGGVLVAYMAMLGGDNAAAQQLFGTHLLTASLLNAPAAVVVAKLLMPETEPINQNMEISKDKIGENVFDAAVEGTTNGLKLAFNVGAILLVFTGLIAMLNFAFERGPGAWFGLNTWVVEWTEGNYDGFSLQFILGMLFAPVAWLIGVENHNLLLVGQLLGEKTVLNEFVAYSNLGEMIHGERILGNKSIIIATFALCGFANFASMGIQIGGIGTLAPGQRKTLAELAFRALIGGTTACLMTGCLAGVILG